MLCSHSWAELLAVAFTENGAFLDDLAGGDPAVIAGSAHVPAGFTLTSDDANLFCTKYHQELVSVRSNANLSLQQKTLEVMKQNLRCPPPNGEKTVWTEIAAEGLLSEEQQDQLALFFHNVVAARAISACQQGITDGAERRLKINGSLGRAVSATARVYTEAARRSCE